MKMSACWSAAMAHWCLLMLSVATLLAGCASAASTWYREGATQETTSGDIAACQARAGQIGYGLVAGDDYLQRCMEAKGYRAA
jgi:hypothetical protein